MTHFATANGHFVYKSGHFAYCNTAADGCRPLTFTDPFTTPGLHPTWVTNEGFFLRPPPRIFRHIDGKLRLSAARPAVNEAQSVSFCLAKRHATQITFPQPPNPARSFLYQHVIRFTAAGTNAERIRLTLYAPSYFYPTDYSLLCNVEINLTTGLIHSTAGTLTTSPGASWNPGDTYELRLEIEAYNTGQFSGPAYHWGVWATKAGASLNPSYAARDMWTWGNAGTTNVILSVGDTNPDDKYADFETIEAFEQFA